MVSFSILAAFLQLASAAPSVALDAPSVYAADVGVDAAITAGVPSVSSLEAVSAAPSAAVDLKEPISLPEALNKVSVVVDLYKAGQWLALALLLVNLLMFGFKRFVSDSAKRKWGFIVSVGSGGVIALLSAVMAGVSWPEAALVFVAGPLSSVVYDLIKALKAIKA